MQAEQARAPAQEATQRTSWALDLEQALLQLLVEEKKMIMKQPTRVNMAMEQVLRRIRTFVRSGSH